MHYIYKITNFVNQKNLYRSNAKYKTEMAMKKTSELLKLAEIFEGEIEKQAAKWKIMPEGWKPKSRKSFFQNIGDESVGECMKRIKDHVTDPGAFCASLKDRTSGKEGTFWRKGNPKNLKKKKKNKKK
jgi:hypothetical protein